MFNKNWKVHLLEFPLIVGYMLAGYHIGNRELKTAGLFILLSLIFFYFRDRELVKINKVSITIQANQEGEVEELTGIEAERVRNILDRKNRPDIVDAEIV